MTIETIKNLEGSPAQAEKLALLVQEGKLTYPQYVEIRVAWRKNQSDYKPLGGDLIDDCQKAYGDRIISIT